MGILASVLGSYRDASFVKNAEKLLRVCSYGPTERGHLLHRLLLVLLATGIGTVGYAAEITRSVGTTQVVIPVPNGLVDASRPEVMNLLAETLPKTGRLLAVFVTPEDDKIMRSGTMPWLDRMVLIQVIRKEEARDYSSSQFAAYRASMRTVGGRQISALQDETNSWARGLTSDPARPPQVGSLAPLDTVLDAEDVFAKLMLTTYVADGRTHSSVTSVTAMLLREKVISFNAISSPKARPADGQWVRLTTMEWVDKARRANR